MRWGFIVAWVFKKEARQKATSRMQERRGLECHEMTGRMTALLAFDNLQLNLFVRPSTVFPAQDVAALILAFWQRYATVNYQLVVAVRAKVKQGVALLFL